MVPTVPLFALAVRLASGCVAPGEYPVVDAAVDPGFDLRSAKVYFRSDKYPKFYFIEMKPEGARLRSVLPKPNAATEKIVYYIETIDVLFHSSVSDEQVLEVRTDCLEKDGAEEVGSAPPEITVGAVEAGSPAIPPGFEAVGIVGAIASTGVLTGLGGGSSIGTAAVVGGLAAAGAGGAVVAASGSSEPSPSERDSSSGSPPPTTTSATTTTVRPTTTVPTTSTTTTTAATTTIPAPQSISACFSASFPGNSCNLKLDAGCSTGPIAAWEWVIDPGSAFGGPTTATGPEVNRNFPQCAGETVHVTLTVRGSGGASDSATQTIKLPLSQRQSVREFELCTFTSFLSSRELSGGVVPDRARVDYVRGGISSSHVLPARPGSHEIEAFLTAAHEGEAFWTFDFSSCEALSSLEPSQGHAIALGGRRIAFRLEGAAGARLLFRFRLSR